VVLAAFAAAAAACGLFPDLSDLGGDGGAPTDATSNDVISQDGGDAALADAGMDAPNDVSSGDAAACPSGQGPTMIHVGPKTCIDSTEVTVAQYRAFVQAVDGGAPITQPPECAFNTTVMPYNGVPGTSKDNNPIAQINWCQAYAFCAWAGKSLCGGPDGGAVPFGSFALSSASLWTNACTNNGAQSYPYGSSFDAGACNLGAADGAAGSVLPVTQKAGCVGALPGLYDMVGNIKEWENSCSGTAGAADDCQRRGSGFDEANDPNGNCNWPETDTRDHQSYTSGVRCCAYLP